jgi:hypothetical protein
MREKYKYQNLNSDAAFRIIFRISCVFLEVSRNFIFIFLLHNLTRKAEVLNPTGHVQKVLNLVIDDFKTCSSPDPVPFIKEKMNSREVKNDGNNDGIAIA